MYIIEFGIMCQTTKGYDFIVTNFSSAVDVHQAYMRCSEYKELFEHDGEAFVAMPCVMQPYRKYIESLFNESDFTLETHTPHVIGCAVRFYNGEMWQQPLPCWLNNHNPKNKTGSANIMTSEFMLWLNNVAEATDVLDYDLDDIGKPN